MMSAPRLVNNQFNSPIKLYSPENIQETLERQTQVLSNGAVGIDFNKISKPANLQNSAVLRMLEEEEQRKKSGKPGLRRVEWPPTREGTVDYVDFVEQNPVQSKTRGVGEYATYQSKSPTLREESTTPKLSISQPSYQPSQQQEPEHHTSAKSWTPGTPTSAKPWTPVTPISAKPWTPVTPTSAQQPKEYVVPVSSNWSNETAQPSPLQTSQPKNWASVTSPTAFSPQSANNQQKEFIVPVSCNWKSSETPQQQQQQPTSQVNAPKSFSNAPQQKEYLIPVSCPWKNEAQTSPPQPTFAQSSNDWNKVPSHFENSTSDLPTLNTWKPQSQQQQQQQQKPEAWTAKPQIQIKQTPPTPTNNTWSDKPQQFGNSWNDHPQQQQQQHTLTVSQEVESPQSYKPQSPAAHFEPPATFITLRAEPPISQEPSPVYHAQPAAVEAGYDATNMRGDQKWPPASVKEQTEAENRARIELAKGPVFRPRRVNKDYSSFFAQHAVTNNYPGYRVPPGTQYFTPAYQQ